MLKVAFIHPFASCLFVISSVSTTLTAQIAQEAYLKASNTEGGISPLFLGDEFGRSVAVDGNTVVVGAYQEDSASTGVNQDQTNNGVRNSGAAYVFLRDALGQWAQQAYLKASNTGTAPQGPAGDWFGYAVAVSGDTAVVGAFREGNVVKDSGAAYIFVRDETGNWAQQAYLKASNAGEGDGFGYSVAISGATVVIAAPWESSAAIGVNGNQSDNSALHSGAVYVFARNGATWTQQAYLKASNTGTSDLLGYSVAIGGDIIVAGAIQEQSGATGVNGDQNDNSASWSGAAYAFQRNGTNWSQQAYLKPSKTGSQSFGSSVGVSGDTVVVGAYNEDGMGGAHIFVRAGTNWSQEALLKASNGDPVDVFGGSVAISGHTVVVGALGEDSNATGVDGNAANNSVTDSGAAYVFVRSGRTWTQRAYLKASNTGLPRNDNFGRSVAISGSTVIVGAHQEDSSAVGVNGEQTNNDASNSGAAYVFKVPVPVSTGCDGFCITSFYVQPNSVTITWRSQPGHTYYIGSKADPMNPHWTPVSGGIVAQGAQASWTGLRASGAASAFYCVVMLN